MPVRTLNAIGIYEEKEFGRVLCDLFVELQPVGMIEAMLVERMAYCHFQLSRIARYHAALITLAADKENSEPTWPSVSKEYEEMVECTIQIQRARIALQECGFLDTTLLANLKSVILVEDRVVVIEKFNALLVSPTQRERAISDSEAKSWKGAILQALKAAEREEVSSYRECEKMAKERWNAQAFQHLFPDSAGMEKILRYESQYESGFYRALAKLEYLQRQRLGEVAPQFPKLTM